MVLKREQFNLERIATKNTIKVLRFLTSKQYLSFGLTELSEYLKISRDEVEDGLNAVEKIIEEIEKVLESDI
jgi:translation elongation factor EF-1beta